MLIEDRLAKALLLARDKRGWTIHQAANRIGFPSHNTLRTLEGLNPDRSTHGLDCKLDTVLKIVSAYWPDVTLEDFVEERCVLKFVPKDAKAQRKLKGYLAATG
jgi:hypothetical protein